TVFDLFWPSFSLHLCTVRYRELSEKKRNKKNKQINTMKKVILSLAIVAVAIVGVKAQTPVPTGSANVKVNVVLNPVLSISLGSGATAGTDEVTLTYNTTEDYTQGVTAERAKQLKVTSIGS